MRHLWAELEGRRATLEELEEVAEQVTDHYRRHGYALAYAYVPAQEVEGGVVTLAVVEGRYSGVTIANASRLREERARALLAPVIGGALIEQAALSRAMQRVNNTAGVAASALLRAGDVEGAAELVVDIWDERMWSGAMDVDNFGNAQTGIVRSAVAVSRHNVTGRGDSFGLNVVTSGHGLLTGRISYEFVRPTVRDIERWSVAYSRTQYDLGGTFAVLDAHGIAESFRISGLERTHETSRLRLDSGLGYEFQRLTDTVFGIVTPRRVQRIELTLRAASDGSVASNQLTLDVRFGHLSIDDPVARRHDANSARTAGGFTTLHTAWQHHRWLRKDITLSAAWSGQWSSDNLHSSEKFSLGGPVGVRAYAGNEATGDEGWLANVSVHKLLPWPGLRVGAFVDGGWVRFDKRPWNGAEPNQRTLTGAGVGFAYEPNSRTSVVVEYGVPVGDPAPDEAGRLWWRGTWRF